MSEGANTPDVKPARLAPMTIDQVKASAQRILDLRGRPPYTPKHPEFNYIADKATHEQALSEDELRVISEFVQFWLPFLVEKEKK